MISEHTPGAASFFAPGLLRDTSEVDMASRMTHRQRIFHETTTARDKARALLRGLETARATSERLGAERPDAMKQVTGRSAIDNAIDSTRRMVETLERTLDQLRKELREEDEALLQDLLAS